MVWRNPPPPRFSQTCAPPPGSTNRSSGVALPNRYTRSRALNAFGLAAAGGFAKAGEVAVARAPRSGKAKNIIFLVSDGMSQGTLTMADQFIQMRDGRKSHWMQMYHDHPVTRGMMDMTSATAK